MRKLLSLLAALICTISFSFAATNSGLCGTNLNWTLDTETGVLAITGSGAMDNYTYSSPAPWASYRTEIESISFPTGLTNIGDLAFDCCTNVSSVRIPNTVTQIGFSAFRSCNNLKNVRIMDGTTSLSIGSWHAETDDEDNAFTTALTSLYIGRNCSLRTATWNTFLSELTDITVGPNVTDLESIVDNSKNLVTLWISADNSSFSYSDGMLFNKDKTELKRILRGRIGSLVIPSSVTSINDKAGFKADYLTRLTIPSSVTTIGYQAFAYCQNLDSVNIQNAEVGYMQFYGCSNLTSVSFSENIRKIGGLAFGYAKEVLEYDEYGESDYAYYPQNSVTRYNVPDLQTWLGITHEAGNSSMADEPGGLMLQYGSPQLYIGDSLLTTAVIPDNTTHLKAYAFAYVRSLKSITIPKSVSSIGVSALEGCTGLREITSKATTPPSSSTTSFLLVSSSIPVNVPVGSTSAYKAATGWRNFTKFLEPDNIIVYTATSELNISETAFSPNYTSHTFADGIGTITFPGAVTSIGTSAFSGCSALQSIAMPKTITSIGGNAFRGCTSLASITIPDSVLYISSHTFRECTGLTSIKMPHTITLIGDYVFADCTSLTSITIPDSVTSIGSNAFYGCTGLSTITFPSSVSSIGSSAFQNCTGLTAVNISDLASWCSIELASSYANPLCYAHNLYLNGELITDLVIPNSINAIGGNAFYGCSCLTSVTIPNSVTVIAYRAFYNCSGLTRITCEATTPPRCGDECFLDVSESVPVYVPEGTVSAYQSANGWREFTNILEPHTIIYTATSELNISETAFTPNFTSHIFADGIGKITFPDDVTNINDSAFYGCTGLTSITIPNTVSVIGRSAFRGCTSLTTITIPNSVTSISDYAFYGCTDFTSVTLPNSVTSIGSYAFNGCTGLTTMTLGNSVDSIENSSFKGCTALTSITFPESVTYIGANAFNGCTGLTSVTIPESIKVISSNAFIGCTGIKSVYVSNLTSWCSIKFISNCSTPVRYAHKLYLNGELITDLVIPDSVTSIGNYAFYGCTDFTSVTIPNSVTSIGNYAFYGCTGLTSLNLPNSVTSIGGNAFNGTGLTSVAIPESITAIGPNAFNGCTNLTSVTIPNSVTSIGNYAFNGCTGLTSVTIPNSVTSIGGNVFNGCTGLTSLHMESCTPPTIQSTTFSSTSIEVVVPIGARDNYTSATTWSNFTNLREYALELTVNDNAAGTAAYTAICDSSLVILTATANSGYQFKQWSDGSTDNPRRVVIDRDTVFMAVFEQKNTSGDANGDSEVDVQDVSATVEYILGHNPEPFDATLADVDQDGVVDVCDVAQIVNIILYGSPERPSANLARAYAAGTPELSASGLEIMPSEEAVMPILLTDAGHSFTALQMDIQLPEGISLEGVDAGNRSQRHSLVSEQLPDGSYRIVLYSLGNATFVNDSDCLLKLRLKADEGYKQPEATLRLTAVTAATASGRKMQLGDAEAELICPVASAIEQLDAYGNAPQKYISDGILYIRRGEHLYDSTGRLVE